VRSILRIIVLSLFAQNACHIAKLETKKTLRKLDIVAKKGFLIGFSAL